MVTAELKADEIFKPKRFAKHAVVNKINQWCINMPAISKIRLPTNTNVKVCIAEKRNMIPVFDKR